MLEEEEKVFETAYKVLWLCVTIQFPLFLPTNLSLLSNTHLLCTICHTAKNIWSFVEHTMSFPALPPSCLQMRFSSSVGCSFLLFLAELIQDCNKDPTLYIFSEQQQRITWVSHLSSTAFLTYELKPQMIGSNKTHV